ncbi:MAG: hypothetical protein HY318_10320 [Armatimonadetes bacterium]|nr:hypothetical protein [Armatimonadota bacterium]
MNTEGETIHPSPDLEFFQQWRAELSEVATQNLPMARQAALFAVLWHESCFTSEGLIARVEALLGRGCFGRSAIRTLRRDLCVVRAALAQRGHPLRYSRSNGRQGYCVAGRPPVDERLARLIVGSVAEVDPRQVAILHRLRRHERFSQGRSMTNLAQRVGAYRWQQRKSETTARLVS